MDGSAALLPSEITESLNHTAVARLSAVASHRKRFLRAKGSWTTQLSEHTSAWMAATCTARCRQQFSALSRRTVPTSGVRAAAAAAAAAPRRGVSQLAGLTSQQRPAMAAPPASHRSAHLVGAQTETLSAELEFDHDKTTVLFKVPDSPGALNDVLTLFGTHSFDMTHIHSTMSKDDVDAFEFEIDFKGDELDKSVSNFLDVLRDQTEDLRVLGKKQVPWFPRHISDFDHFTQKTLDAEEDLESDHPGFNDPAYRQRRADICATAMRYKAGTGRVPNPIETVSAHAIRRSQPKNMSELRLLSTGHLRRGRGRGVGLGL